MFLDESDCSKTTIQHHAGLLSSNLIGPLTLEVELASKWLTTRILDDTQYATCRIFLIDTSEKCLSLIQ